MVSLYIRLNYHFTNRLVTTLHLVCFKNLNRFWKILLSPRMIKGQSNDWFFFLDEYCIIRNKIAFLSTMPPSNRFRDVPSAKTLVFFLFLAFYLVNFRSLKDLFVYLGVFLSYRSTGSSWNQLYSLYERTASFINVHIPLLNIFFIISGQGKVGGWSKNASFCPRLG